MNIQIAVVIAFLLMLLVIGLLASRSIQDEEDWMIAGKTLGVLPLTGTYFATIVSSVSVVGYLGYYYEIGWGGWWNWAGTAVTTLICGAWFAKKIRTFGKVTLSDFLEDRYGPKHALIGAIFISIAMIFFVSAQLVGSSAVLSHITGLNRNVSILILAILFMIFTATGGMKAVAWTDTFCALIIILGIYAMLPKSLEMVGGIKQLHQTLYKTNPSALDPFAGGEMPLGLIISWILTWGIGNFGAPQFITRFNSAKDVKSAEQSQAYVGVLLLISYIPLMLIALSAMVAIPGIKGGSDNIAPTIIDTLLSPGFAGFVMAGVLAASISTADSVLLLGSTTFVNDIYAKVINTGADSKKYLMISRISTLLIAIIAVLIAISSNSTIMWIQSNAIGFMGSMMSVVVLGGFAWKRANSQGAAAAMITGFLTATIWYILDKPFNWFPILPSIFTSLIALIVVSLLTPEPSKDIVNIFFAESEF
ncbi:MAG: sodium:solute symporter family protein [Tissierellia bacterium]|nr:sodium:solute symporter family protein [Tissierellia bacterium]